jgi:hypothetical protein
LARGAAERGGERLLEALRAQGRASVIVTLKAPVRSRPRASARVIEEVLRGVPAAEIEPNQRLVSAPIFMARITRRGWERLSADPRVSRIDLDGEVRGVDDVSAAQIGADRVHALSFLGDGVTIAVLDSGTDIIANPDLDPVLIGEECFCSRFGGCCPDRTARQSGPGSAHTVTTHGPGVMGIIAAQGVRAPLGIAPGARIFMVRVLDDALLATESDILLALDWVITHVDGVRVVNMSIAGGPYVAPCEQGHAFNEGIALLAAAFREKGGLFVAASGNEGNAGALGSPACVSSVISVGAVNSLDQIEPYSDADATLDLLAPGHAIRTCSSFGRVENLTGTSAAAPHVAGAIALMLSANPDLSPDAIEMRLKRQGVGIYDARNGLTLPRVDVFHALALPMDVAVFPPRLPLASRGKGLELRLQPRLPALASDLEPASLRVSLDEGPEQAVDAESASLADADGDGILDLTVGVDRRSLLAERLGAGEHSLLVQGTLRSGIGVMGSTVLTLFQTPGRGPGQEPTP